MAQKEEDKKNTTIDDWMVRISFAEAGEPDMGFKLTGLEVERKTKSGDLIWLINQYTPVQDEKGNISKVLYLAHDVTEYKKSEKEANSKALEIESKEQELKNSIGNLEKAKNS